MNTHVATGFSWMQGTKAMNRILSVGLVLIGIGTAGCAGFRGHSQPFRPVDLNGNLTKNALSRYEREWEAVHEAGLHGDMARLEHSNWWLPGLVAYWRRGSVMGTVSEAGGLDYHVASARGLGPLSVLFAAEKHATFDSRGERLSGMQMGSLLWGHLAMFHRSDALLPDGTRQKDISMHLLHHLISIHRMDGHTSVTLFSMPNPLGVEASSHGGGRHSE